MCVAVDQGASGRVISAGLPIQGALDTRGHVMLHKMKTIVVAAVLLSSASAALARPIHASPPPNSVQSCTEDEGSGRTKPCDAG
ncbi:MAG TPA: hypothetical protein VK281_04755 [Xanthobacteraceae bacterium]|jgi:hypothetical protein|nr:hypothetical protein [Xanthobacteraceae bacterium]